MSDFDFGAIDPERSIVFLPFDGQFRQDVGENLWPDGSMDDPTTAEWYAVGGSISKQTTSPAEGTRWLEHDAANGNYVRNNTGNPLVQLHMTGWAKGSGNGFASPRILTVASTWVGTQDPAWQPFDIIFTPTIAQVRLYCYDGSAANPGKIGWDGIDLREHPQVCRSLAKQVGVLNYARMGDGHTASSMPTQKTGGRGVFFDTSTWVDLDWAVGGALDRTDLTVLTYGRAVPTGANRRLFQMGDGSDGFDLFFDAGTEELTLNVENSVSGDTSLALSEGYADNTDKVIGFASDASGTSLYVEDKVISVAGDVRPAALDAASVAYIGQTTAGANRLWGDMYSFAIYPGALSATQIREWGRRARQMRNV
jgi:hypothetical protein